MRVYFDTSALVKRVVAERESTAVLDLIDRLHALGDQFVCSQFARVEVNRAIRALRQDGDPRRWVDAADGAMSQMIEIEPSVEILDVAARIGPPVLRSLDAIHLATAMLTECDLLVSYDRIMLRVGEELGLAVLRPE